VRLLAQAPGLNLCPDSCDVPVHQRYSSFALLVSYVEHEDERSVTAGYILYRSRTGNADSISPKHDAGVQRNLLGYLHMNPPAGYINAPSRRTSNLSAFVKPGQPDWFVGRNAPIKAPEFKCSSLHHRVGIAPRVASVSMTASRLATGGSPSLDLLSKIRTIPWRTGHQAGSERSLTLPQAALKYEH
jgi:hypothetical protein